MGPTGAWQVIICFRPCVCAQVSKSLKPFTSWGALCLGGKRSSVSRNAPWENTTTWSAAFNGAMVVWLDRVAVALSDKFLAIICVKSVSSSWIKSPVASAVSIGLACVSVPQGGFSGPLSGVALVASPVGENLPLVYFSLQY